MNLIEFINYLKSNNAENIHVYFINRTAIVEYTIEGNNHTSLAYSVTEEDYNKLKTIEGISIDLNNEFEEGNKFAGGIGEVVNDILSFIFDVMLKIYEFILDLLKKLIGATPPSLWLILVLLLFSFLYIKKVFS